MSWIGPRSVDGGVDEVPYEGPGRIWLCGRRVTAPDPVAALERSDCADFIVCMCERGELTERYPDYVDWLQASDGTAALWFPTPDLHAPSFEDALAMVMAVAERLQRGESALIHCGAGIGRAPTFAICSLIALGMSRADALAIVAEHRPMAGPETGAQADLVEAMATHFRR